MTDNETTGKEGLGKVGTQVKDGVIGCLKGGEEKMARGFLSHRPLKELSNRLF